MPAACVACMADVSRTGGAPRKLLRNAHLLCGRQRGKLRQGPQAERLGRARGAVGHAQRARRAHPGQEPGQRRRQLARRGRRQPPGRARHRQRLRRRGGARLARHLRGGAHVQRTLCSDSACALWVSPCMKLMKAWRVPAP